MIPDGSVLLTGKRHAVSPEYPHRPSTMSVSLVRMNASADEIMHIALAQVMKQTNNHDAFISISGKVILGHLSIHPEAMLCKPSRIVMMSVCRRRTIKESALIKVIKKRRDASSLAGCKKRAELMSEVDYPLYSLVFIFFFAVPSSKLVANFSFKVSYIHNSKIYLIYTP